MVYLRIEAFSVSEGIWVQVAQIDLSTIRPEIWNYFGRMEGDNEPTHGILPQFSNIQAFTKLRFSLVGSQTIAPFTFSIRLPRFNPMFTITNLISGTPVIINNPLSTFSTPSWGFIYAGKVEIASPVPVSYVISADRVAYDSPFPELPYVNVQQALDAILNYILNGYISYERLSNVNITNAIQAVNRGKYIPGSLVLYRNGQPLPKNTVVETDPTQGLFTVQLPMLTNEQWAVSYFVI